MTHYKKHKLYKRKDGRWQIAFTVDKQKYFAYGKTQKECCENYDKKLVEIKNNQKFHKIMFYDWIEYYLTNYAVKLKSYRTLAHLAKNYLYKYFPNKEINLIKPIELDTVFNNLKNTRTKMYLYQFLHKILKTAYKKQILKQDISEFIEPIRYKSQKGNVISSQDIGLIFTHCHNNDVKNLLKFYYFTGVRKSEAFYIMTDDIDWQKGQIHIRGTKRDNSDRYIPIFKNLEKLFREMQIDKLKDNKQIFRISDTKLKVELNRIKNETGIKFSIKDFRTSFATRCFEIGINEKVLQEWMGHAQSSTTKDYYVFVQDETKRANAEKFDYFFDYFFDEKKEN